MKKILTLVLMLLLIWGLSLANQVPQARYYDDDYFDDDRYENDYDYDDYLEDKYEREAYLRAQAQYKNRAQQTPLSTNNTPRTNSGDTLSQLANTADLFDTCEINGVPVSCQELINKGNQIISQTPILRWLFWDVNGFFQFIALFTIFGGLISLAGFIFVIWMLIDLFKYQKEDTVAWLLAIIFLPLVWSLLYYFIAKRSRAKTEEINTSSKSSQTSNKNSEIIDVD